jgi:hypothetical protein
MDTATVSVIFSGLIGLGGLALAGHELNQRKTIAQADREHQRQLARDELTYADRRDIYLEVAEYLERWSLVVQRTNSAFAANPPPEPPEMPEETEQIRLQSRVAVFGSAEVNEGLRRFAKAAFEFSYANVTYLSLQRTATEGLVEAGADRERLRGEVRGELLSIERQIRDELRSGGDTGTTPGPHQHAI